MSKSPARQFVSRKKSLVCRTCNTKLLLSHKAALNNVRQHVNSTSHLQKVKTFGKAVINNISSLFTKKGDSVENSE